MDEFIGTIKLFAFNYAPQGWMACEGQLLSVVQNQALFALIGNTYGGDGMNNFALPNLKGAEPLPQMKYYICIEGIFPPRNY